MERDPGKNDWCSEPRIRSRDTWDVLYGQESRVGNRNREGEREVLEEVMMN
jgi:hypothetical protein